MIVHTSRGSIDYRTLRNDIRTTELSCFSAEIIVLFLIKTDDRFIRKNVTVVITSVK